MKCDKCDKQNPEGSKFCAHCGGSFEKTKEFIHQDLVDEVTDHLEFIGYEIGEPENIDNGKHVRIVARHNNRSNIMITFNNNGMITFVSFYNLDENKVAKKWLDALKAINKMNLESLVCSYSISDGGNSLVCSSWYPKDYSKRSFSDFIDSYENDIKTRIDTSGIIDYT